MEDQIMKIMQGFYDKKKEQWPALRMIINRGGNVKLEGDILMVRLRRFHNQEIDYAARHLCEELNKMGSKTLDCFHFKIHFAVE